MSSFNWFSPVSNISGVGPKISEKLSNLQINIIGDLLLHFPFRYQNKTHLTPICDLVSEQVALIQGTISNIEMIKKGKKRCNILLTDKTGSIHLIFFHLPFGQKLKPNTILRCYGEVRRSRAGFEMVHPEYEVISAENEALPKHYESIYPSTAGLGQKILRRIVSQALTVLTEQDEDLFQQSLKQEVPMLSWIHALKTIHQPEIGSDIEALMNKRHPAYNRLIIEELVANHLNLKNLRAKLKEHVAISLPLDQKNYASFLKLLNFELTSDQERVWLEIANDLFKTTPMVRLVQGDVGCGKTVLAGLSALTAVTHQTQVAIMVPTEVLAQQHYQQFKTWFEPLGYQCDLLTKNNRIENMDAIDIVIGTHALFQASVIFKKLGLVIIDEQHRFGVHQRFALQKKGNAVHQLIMTATPIPRTLAMSHYGHLDISTIKELPKGRQPITTAAIASNKRQSVIERMRGICEKGQQVYWVCTLINESDELEHQAAQTIFEILSDQLKPLRVGIVHGQMTSLEKEQVLQDFYAGDLSVLVATTVIEVGVNVPNASLMVIENPERLGLAQLHQLRGRVGRGAQPSYCILLYQDPLSDIAKARLNILRQTQDGFVIAQADLDLRGPGEVLGARQTGAVQFKVADLTRDQNFLKIIPSWTEKLKTLPTDQLAMLIQRWCHAINHGFAQIG